MGANKALLCTLIVMFAFKSIANMVVFLDFFDIQLNDLMKDLK